MICNLVASCDWGISSFSLHVDLTLVPLSYYIFVHPISLLTARWFSHSDFCIGLRVLFLVSCEAQSAAAFSNLSGGSALPPSHGRLVGISSTTKHENWWPNHISSISVEMANSITRIIRPLSIRVAISLLIEIGDCGAAAVLKLETDTNWNMMLVFISVSCILVSVHQRLAGSGLGLW